jgi:glucose-6-phosphate 1-dehydrogenase
LFGATGDLAQRKLLPDLFHLAAAGLMPDRYQIIGSFRRQMTDEAVAVGTTGWAIWTDTRRRCPWNTSSP